MTPEIRQVYRVISRSMRDIPHVAQFPGPARDVPVSRGEPEIGKVHAS